MKRYLMLLSLLLAVLAMTGCDSLHVEATFEQPTKATVILPTQAPQLAASAEPSAAPSQTPQPAASAGSTATPTQVPQTTAPVSPASPVPPAAGTAPGVAAVQTVLDYLGAINDQDYARAYAYWDGEGSASGQTYDQFAKGFADTVRVTAQVDVVDLETHDAQAVTVPVILAAIANAPGTPLGQIVQCYSGTYTLGPRSAGWRIVSAALAETASLWQPPADFADPAAVLRGYFDAINRREFGRAYTYWENLGQASRQTFAQFVAGFATTADVAFQLGEVQTDAGAGNLYARVPVIIVATQADGSVQTYSGTYEFHRANLQPWDQLGWRVQGANIAPAESVQLGSPEAQHMLEVAGAQHMPPQ